MLFQFQSDKGANPEETERLPLICALVSGAIAFLALTYSFVDKLSWVRSDGLEIGAHPLVLIGLLLLSASFVMAIFGISKLPEILASIALASIALLAIDKFADAGWGHGLVANLIGFQPSKAVPIANLFILALATWFARRCHGWSGTAAIACGTLALVVAIVSLLLAISDVIDPAILFPQMLMSPIGAICSVFLASAILVHRRESGWPRLFWSARFGPLVKIGFPAILAIPVVTLLTTLLCVRLGLLSYAMAGVVSACADILALSIIFLWAAWNGTRDQSSLHQAAEALDLAAVIITDIDGTVLHWSEGCERLYGWSAAEAVGQSKYHLLQSMEQGKPAPPPARISGTTRTLSERNRSGRCITTIEEARLTRQPEGSQRFVISMTEITELIRTTAALRESETRLELALEAHAIGIFERDCLTGEITWASGSEERLGLPPGQITTYDSWAESIEPEDFARIRETMKKAVAEEASRFSYSFRFKGSGDGIKVMEGSSRCIYDDNGQLVKTVGVLVDVSNRFEVGRALRTSYEQFQSVLETAPSALIITDEDGAILSFSKSAEQLFGYSAHEMIGHSISLLTKEAYGVPDRGDAFTAEQARTVSEMRILTARHRNGSHAPVQVWVREFGSDGARLFTIFMRDITDKVLAEERLYDLRDELTHVARVNTMGEVAAGIAHELNQPLSAMTNFLGAVKFALRADTSNTEQLNRLVDQASEQAMRAGDIIRRMRQFVSRGEMEMQPVPVGKIVDEAVALASLGGRQHDIALDIDIPAELPRVLADRVQIEQVLVNLLRNAIDELREQPRSDRHICVRVRQIDAETVELRVEDNGPGISKSVLDQLYAPFSPSKKKGMGLGLSICRRIVEAHGGELNGENKSEGGAVFRFTLPLIRDEELA